MMTVSLLVFEAVVPSSVTGVLDLLTGANRYLEESGKLPVFNIQIVSEDGKNIPLAQPFQNIGYQPFKGASRSDLIIVPSFNIGDDSVVAKNKAAIAWLKEMNAAGTEIASLCAGCYFLAEAGLLDGKEATSHWAIMDDMQKRYPTIKMKSDLVITDKDGIYTSGGAFSSLKLVLYLIEKFCGRETALWISKMFAIDMDRTSNAHFAVFTGQHQHSDNAILKAQRYIEENFKKEISINNLSAMVNMGLRTFIRRFKSATNNTPIEYLQRVRIESAKKAIEINDRYLPYIIEDAGYRDLKTFRIIFKRLTGLSPQEYKKKYARDTNPGKMRTGYL